MGPAVFSIHVRAFVLGCALLGAALVWAGCGESSAEAPAAEAPALPGECSTDKRCAMGEGCFERRCVPLCSADGQCAPRERCAKEGSATGLCVPSETGPPADPCAGKLCLAPLSACHPRTGECVACTGPEHCGPALPVCDRGRGLCVTAEPVLCAACNDDRDCAPDDAGVSLGCLESDEPFERSCVPVACTGDDTCPPGFACSPTRRACFPRRGSCTSQRQAVLAAPCDTPAACSALGVPPQSVHEGTCRSGTCALGCEQTSDCPGVLVCSGLSCVAPEPASPDAG